MSAYFCVPSDRMTRRPGDQDPIAPIGSQAFGDVRFAQRKFLRFLAGSPLFLSSLPAVAAEQFFSAVALEGNVALEMDLIAAAADAINVFDFEAVARGNGRNSILLSKPERSRST